MSRLSDSPRAAPRQSGRALRDARGDSPLRPAGAFLVPPGAAAEDNAILLLGPEIPPDAGKGDQVSVFVALDSAGRPLATTTEPHLALGEVAFLRSSVTEFGAFVDWGLPRSCWCRSRSSRAT